LAVIFLTNGLFAIVACGAPPPEGKAVLPNAVQIVQIERRRDHVAGPAAFDKLIVVSGKWEHDGAREFQTDKNEAQARALLGDRQWVDCVLRARVKVNSWSKDPLAGLRILLRADDRAQTFCCLNLCFAEQQVRFERPTGTKCETLQMFDNQSGPFKGLAIVPFKLETGRPYALTVVADHGGLHCFIDGKFVVRSIAPDFMEHPFGKVGFGTAHATAEFSDVSVESLYGVTHSPFRFYERNPLNIDARSPTVIHDAGLYKMWFDWGPELGYAESTDGLTWGKPTLLPGFGPKTIKRGQWGDQGKNDAEVLKVGDKYWIFYPAVSSIPRNHWDGMGLQFSTDGIHWTPYEHNPNFYMGPPGSWDEHVIGDHTWIKDGERFKMWFTGINLPIRGVDHPEQGYRNEFGYAESSDGIHWKKCRLNPILKQGAPGDWDSGWISCAAVLKLGDEQLASGVYRGGQGSYHLFYTGLPTNSEKFPGNQRIGYAFSLDGIHWAKYKDPTATQPTYQHSSPLLTWADYGQWGCTGYHSCAVLREGEEVRMWVWGHAHEYRQFSKLGLATAKVSDLLAIVEKAKRDGLLPQFNRQQIDALMFDAPPPSRAGR